jgi:hypothetical protein
VGYKSLRNSSNQRPKFQAATQREARPLGAAFTEVEVEAKLRKDSKSESRRGIKEGAQAGRNFIAALKAVSHQTVKLFESSTQNKRPLT